MVEVILVKKWYNTLNKRYQYNDLFKVIKDGFEGINPEDLLKEKIISAEEVVQLAKLLDSEEEVEDMRELIDKAFEVDPETVADILGIKVYDTLPWEEYHPDIA